ncbi:hypothetical protein DFH28DRAFT_885911 [Melampsora americana]|nr:hypothetical protein DFH28DRAFT_885911 [Melampsora americana]
MGVDDGQSTTGDTCDPSAARTFQVTFNFWQLQVPPPDATNAKRHKKTPGGIRPSKLKSVVKKYENYNPKVPTPLTFDNPGSLSFAAFKTKLFQACDQKLPWVAESLSTAWLAKAVNIQGYINGSRKHKAKKMLINDLESLTEFMDATQLVPASTPMGFKIHHDNPKITANASRFMETLRQGRGSGGGNNHLSSNDTDDDPRSEDTAGSDILSPGERKLCLLMDRFSKDFKRGENVTSVVNPQDPSQCMLLNTARIRTWANDWADQVPGVDEVNPPTKRPDFRWIPVNDYEKEKNLLLGLGPANPSDTASSQGAVVHHNYYAPPFPPRVIPPPYPHPISTALATKTQRLSPPPSMPSFEDFLIFAGIKPEMTKTRQILIDQGIDQFSRLLDCDTYNFENFRSMGIPFAHADDITKAVPAFTTHLKNRASLNGSLSP